VALLDAIRVLTDFDARGPLPPCDLDELADVLDAHGLAPLASWQLESRRLGAGVPMPFRERLLTLYQGTVNDNVFRMMTLKSLLRGVEVPAVVLDGAAYVDWLYPHLAWRPVGELRLAVRGADGPRFADGARPAGFELRERGPGGHTAVFSDGRVDVRLQEGLVAGKQEDQGLFERSEPYRVVGPSAARPSAADALLVSVADVARMGLQAPLLAWLDLRELVLRVVPDVEAKGLPATEMQTAGDAARTVLERAEAAGLSRALHGAMALTGHFFPAVAARAAALAPRLSRPEAVAVDALVDAARDPAKLRRLRGTEEAARLLLSPV
jgi:hypothetical protein